MPRRSRSSSFLPSKRDLFSFARRIRRYRLLPLRRYLWYLLVSVSCLAVTAVLLLAIAVFSLYIWIHFPSLNPEESKRYESLGTREEPRSVVLSWEPRVFMYHNFLSREECEYLIDLAKPRMAQSAVIDKYSGQGRNSSFRTSSSCFLKRGQDNVIRTIEKRIADFTFVPVEHGEALQVVHYKTGERYATHYDYFVDKHSVKNGGQRMATFLMYLTDVEKGGETVFPRANVNISSLPWYGELSSCGKRGLPVKPKKGDAILFWNLKPDGNPDPSSLHEGCPVIEGDKWACTKWLHVNTYKSR